MKSLVLSVDRDDDFGRKAEISSPFIGREANIEAALALGLADPEDSDVNTTLKAISWYDELKSEEKDVEVATICGSKNLTLADDLIVKQLDKIIKDYEIDSIYFVSDGAEDEHILPVIQSRVPINGIRRVIVRQSQNIESMVYLFIRSFEDRKLAMTFMLPLTLIILTISFAALTGEILKGTGVVGVVIGFYLLIRIMRLEGTLIDLTREVYTELTAGKLSYITSMGAFLAASFGLITGYMEMADIEWGKTLGVEQYEMKVFDVGMRFFKAVIWWLLTAYILKKFGKIASSYVETGKIEWESTHLPFGLISFGLIATATCDILIRVIEGSGKLVTDSIFFTYVGGIFVFVIGRGISNYIKTNYIKSEKTVALDWRK